MKRSCPAALAESYGRRGDQHPLCCRTGGHGTRSFSRRSFLLGKGEDVPTSDAVERIQELKSPVDILILMAESCPHCPQAVGAALSLAVGNR